MKITKALPSTDLYKNANMQTCDKNVISESSPANIFKNSYQYNYFWTKRSIRISPVTVLWSDCFWRRIGWFLHIHLLIREVGEVDRSIIHKECTSAILVDFGPGIEVFRCPNFEIFFILIQGTYNIATSLIKT